MKNILIQKIREYATAYYLGEAIVSDSEFDRVVEELRAIDPDCPILKQVGWGLKLYGNKVDLPCEIRHSLEKIHVVTDEWKSAVASPKVDGMTVVLEYENGTLKSAVTRGDGIKGIDITPKSLYIKGIPQTVTIQGRVCVRGELFIDEYTFKNSGMNDTYANPRNAVSGLVNAKGFDLLENVTFIAHPSVDCIDPIKYLPEYPIPESCDMVQFKNDHQDLFDYYPTDGIVLRHRDSMDAIAFKFKTEAYETVVKEIIWSIGKGGKLIPVAEYEPVNMYGTICTRVTALHYKYVYENRLGPKAVIKVTKANSIIPQIVEVVSPSPLNPSEYLPTCEYEIEGVHAVMQSPEIVYLQSLISFIKWHFDIDGFKRSEDIFRRLYGVSSFNFLKDVVDAMDSIPAGDLVKYLSDNGYRAIAERWVQNFKSPKYLDLFFGQVGIHGIGSSFATNLDSILKDHSNINDVISHATTSNLVNITAKNALVKYADYFNEAYSVFEGKWVWKEGKSCQETFSIRACITGSLSMTKKEFSNCLKSVGIEYVDYVDSSVQMLIIPDNNEKKSSKLKKAESLGIKIMSESEVRKEYNI